MKNEKTRRQPGLSLNKFRVWIVLVGAVILACAMTLSYNHTVDLFKYAGYIVWLSHIGTVMIELTFFLGTSVIILSRAVGMAAGWPARATFIFGAALVLWSNVSSGIMLLDEQWTAVVLGVAVVTCLFLMEAVVSRALFMFRDDVQAEQAEESESVQTNGQTVQKPDAVVAETTEDRLKIDGKDKTADTPAETVQENVQSVHKDVHDVLEIDGNDSVHVQNVQTDVQSVYETADTPAETVQENVQNVQTDVHDVLEIDGNDSVDVQDVQNVHETAAARLYNYHKENGKLPGRVRLAKMCDMDVKVARRLLDRMNRGETPEEVA